MFDPIQFKCICTFNLIRIKTSSITVWQSSECLSLPLTGCQEFPGELNGPKIHQKPSDFRLKPVIKSIRMENFRSCHNYLIQLNLTLWSLINTSNTFQYMSFPDKRDASLATLATHSIYLTWKGNNSSFLKTMRWLSSFCNWEEYWNTSKGWASIQLRFITSENLEKWITVTVFYRIFRW